MRVYLLITDLDQGGAEGQFVRLALGLLKRGVSVRVGTLKGGGVLVQPLLDAGIRVDCFNIQGPFSLVRFPALVRALRAFRPDILQAWLIHANILGRVAGTLAGVGKVISSVRVAERERGYHLLWDRWTRGLVDGYLTNAEAVKTFTAERVGVAPEKIGVIYNGVEPFETGTPAPQFFPDKPIRLLHIGRINRQKGHAFLLEALSLLKKPMTVDCLGVIEPGEMARLEGQYGSVMERCALSDLDKATRPARFCGPVTPAQIRAALLSHQALVLPSLWEGAPNVVLEAQSAGLPVIATSVDGTLELIREGESGLLVPPGDVGALAAALEKLFADPALWTRLAEGGKRNAEKFSPQAFIENHLAFYEKL